MSRNQPVQLHSHTLERVTLRGAFQAALPVLETGKEPAVAFLYTPSRFIIARVQDRNLTDSGGNAVSCEPVFEARIFNLQVELRWLHEGEGVGAAVLVSERAGTAPEWSPEPAWTPATRDYRGFLKNRYLLWGQADPAGVLGPNAPHWTPLSESCVGRIDVPLCVDPGQRVVLETREYLEVIAPHGNVVVGEERFLRFTPYRAGGAGTMDRSRGTDKAGAEAPLQAGQGQEVRDA